VPPSRQAFVGLKVPESHPPVCRPRPGSGLIRPLTRRWLCAEADAGTKSISVAAKQIICLLLDSNHHLKVRLLVTCFAARQTCLSQTNRLGLRRDDPTPERRARAGVSGTGLSDSVLLDSAAWPQETERCRQAMRIQRGRGRFSGSRAPDRCRQPRSAKSQTLYLRRSPVPAIKRRVPAKSAA
jgi:hypothetical protein